MVYLEFLWSALIDSNCQRTLKLPSTIRAGLLSSYHLIVSTQDTESTLMNTVLGIKHNVNLSVSVLFSHTHTHTNPLTRIYCSQWGTIMRNIKLFTFISLFLKLKYKRWKRERMIDWVNHPKNFHPQSSANNLKWRAWRTHPLKYQQL